MGDMNSMNDLFAKVKQASTTIPNNESESVSGKLQVYDDDTARQGETSLGAAWGNVPSHDPVTYSTGLDRETQEGRPDLLGRIFQGVPGMVAADQATISSLFVNGGVGRHEAHSPLLQKKASHAPPPTLAETVRRLR